MSKTTPNRSISEWFLNPKRDIRNTLLAIMAFVPLKMANVGCNGESKMIEINQPDIVFAPLKAEEVEGYSKMNPAQKNRLEEIIRLSRHTRYELSAQNFVENGLGQGKKALCREMPDNAVGVIRQTLTETNPMVPQADPSNIQKAVVCVSDDPKSRDSVMLGLDCEANVLAAK